jgi:hypothetical protein
MKMIFANCAKALITYGLVFATYHAGNVKIEDVIAFLT